MKEMLKKKLRGKKGFTLAELLIVVAIIAVLAAIAFPVFSAQLAKAQAGADLANLRNAISVASTELLTNSTITDENSARTAINKAIKESMGNVEPQYNKTSEDFYIALTPGSTSKLYTVNKEQCTFGGTSYKVLENVAKTGNKSTTT